MTTKELYQVAYRNVRCAHSNSFKAKPVAINASPAINSAAVCSYGDYRAWKMGRNSFGWVNFSRYISYVKKLRTLSTAK